MSNKVTESLELVKENCYINSQNVSDPNYCQLIFDGLMCWNATKAGEIAVQPCSNQIIVSHSFNTSATKECLKNGTWFQITNYTECGHMFVADTSNAEMYDIYSDWLPLIQYISYFGYAISILSIISALIIFTTIKRLHCERNKLHVHLFISFILRAFSYFLKDALLIDGTVLRNEADHFNNAAIFSRQFSWICKALISFKHYSIVTNFFFILMEGIYLHNLMFLNLFSYKSKVVFYCVFGWVFPFLFVIPWIIMKWFYEDFYCWTETDNEYIALLIDLPIAITVVINFVLFLIIIRVLFAKIQSICIQQRKRKYRKLLKATLILIPFFGVPYSISLILSFYVKYNQALELLWLLFDQTVSAYQGLFASFVYCIFNTDVQAELRRIHTAIKDRNNKEFRRSRTISHTQQFSLQPLDEHPLKNGFELGAKKDDFRF